MDASGAVPAGDSLAVIRRLLLWLLCFGLAGLVVELLLLGHYEDAWQMVPVFLVGMAFVAIAWHAYDGSALTVRVLQATMVCFVVAGAAGVLLHYRGNLAIQLDIDPAQPRWQLFMRIMRGEAPPALAPGAMAQFGLLGLVYSWRHPALTRSQGSTSQQGG